MTAVTLLLQCSCHTCSLGLGEGEYNQVAQLRSCNIGCAKVKDPDPAHAAAITGAPSPMFPHANQPNQFQSKITQRPLGSSWASAMYASQPWAFWVLLDFALATSF